MKPKKKTSKKKARRRPAKAATKKAAKKRGPRVAVGVSPGDIKIQFSTVIEDSGQRRLAAENRALRHLVYRLSTELTDSKIDAEILRVEAKMRDEATVG